MHLFLSAPPGLEDVAAAEVGGKTVPGGVAIEGSPQDALRIQLISRVGSRLSLQVAEGEPSAVLDLARSVRWQDYVRHRFEVQVEGGGKRPAQLSTPVAQAIARSVPGAVAGGGQVVVLRLASGRLSLLVDASGEHLHLRGWRKETGAAPLRENLAAGILRLAGYDGQVPLLDPMCGSGTFPIEAALLSMGRIPTRRFACEDWPVLPEEVSRALRGTLKAAEKTAPARTIAGSDRNAGALGVARRNAERAGILQALVLSRGDALQVEAPAGAPGIVVANLPFGHRLGETRDLPELHQKLGERLRSHFPGWRAALLTGGGEPARRLGPSRKVALVNGGLRCELCLLSL